MTRTVYLHVGAPKSGATYLQRVLDGNRDRLAEAGVLVVGDRVVDRVHAAYQVRRDPRLKRLPEHRREMWDVLVREIKAWSGESAVLSYDLLSAATARQAARALTDLADFDSHIVITGRDLGHTVASAWQERLKFGLTTSLEDWVPPSVDNQRGDWGWRTTDPASVAERWGAALLPDRVHVVTTPRSQADPSVLWDRFAEAAGLVDVKVDLGRAYANASLGAVEAELLRRVNERLRTPLDTDRELAMWMRDLFADRVLARHHSERLAITEEQYAEATEHAERAIRDVKDAGYLVHGDLEDLRATRPVGRMPGDVSDTEVLDVALGALVDLVIETRGRSISGARPSAADDVPAARRLARGALRRLRGRR